MAGGWCGEGKPPVVQGPSPPGKGSKQTKTKDEGASLHHTYVFMRLFRDQGGFHVYTWRVACLGLAAYLFLFSFEKVVVTCLSS